MTSSFDPEIERAETIRLRARGILMFMAALWGFAFLAVDPVLYGSRLYKLPVRVAELAGTVAGLYLLRRPRSARLLEVTLVALGSAIMALGSISVVTLRWEHLPFALASRLMGAMVLATVVPLTWQATLVFFGVTFASVHGAGFARDPSNYLRDLGLASMTVTAPFPVLVYMAYTRERQRRQDCEVRRALAEANRELVRQEEVRTRLFVNLSHDFRTPLALILGEAELLRDGASPPEAAALLRIESNSRYLAELTEQLLELARLEAGKTPCRPADVPLAALAREIAAQLQPARGEARIDVSGDERASARADPEHVRRILLNLVANALAQVSPRGGAVRVVVGREDGAARVDVEDDGPGVEPARRATIFERFASFDGDGRTASGIGLPLSRELAELNRGSLRLLDVPGPTTFRLVLPEGAPGAVSPIDVPAAAPPEAPTPTQPTRAPVLVVEDNAEMRALIERALGTLFEVRAEATLAAARAALALWTPSAVVCDLLLPDGDGTAVVREVRARAALDGVPVLIVSALGDPEARVAGLRAGADDYVAKPFSPAELAARVGAAVRRAAARRDALRRQREDFLMELHDGVSASLSRAAVLLASRRDGDARGDALAAVREGMDEARTIMSLLDAAPEAWDAVVADVRRELAEACELAGLAFSFETESDGTCPCPSPVQKHTVRRLAREALTNAIKHARARTIHVTLAVAGGVIRLRAQDDGVGLPDDHARGRGLGIMARRAARLGGRLEVGSGPDGGALVEAWLPTELPASPRA